MQTDEQGLEDCFINLFPKLLTISVNCSCIAPNCFIASENSLVFLSCSYSNWLGLVFLSFLRNEETLSRLPGGRGKRECVALDRWSGCPRLSLTREEPPVPAPSVRRALLTLLCCSLFCVEGLLVRPRLFPGLVSCLSPQGLQAFATAKSGHGY